MHNFFDPATGTTLNFNTDLSGDVRVSRNGNVVNVPGRVLLTFIADHVRQMKISDLEDMEPWQVLGLSSPMKG